MYKNCSIFEWKNEHSNFNYIVEPTLSSIKMKRPRLWHYMEEYIDEDDKILIQEIIASSSDAFHNNEILWNEVTSLHVILEEMKAKSICSPNVEEKVHDEDAKNKCDDSGTLAFVQFQCLENLKQLKQMLERGGNAQTQITSLLHGHPTVHWFLSSYNQREKCHNIDEEESRDYLSMIDGISDKLNLVEILDVLEIINEAFELEARLLSDEAEIIRNDIDIQHENKIMLTIFDARTLKEIKRLKKRLETAMKPSALDDGAFSARVIPPLQRNIQHHANSDYGKENENPDTLTTVCNISKKRNKLQCAVNMAAIIKAENELHSNFKKI